MLNCFVKLLKILRNRPLVEKIGIFGILTSILWAIMGSKVYSSQVIYKGSTIRPGEINFEDLGITMAIQFIILILIFGGKDK